MPKKFTFEEVKAYFEEQGCTLLATEYVNNQTPMPYICECGVQSSIKFGHFKSDHRCKNCGIKRRQQTQKTPFEEVKAYFEEQGCTLLATEYVNNQTLMPYICSCGVRSRISWANFKSDHRCKNCGIKKQQESQKTPFEEVKAYFEEQGCTLLATEYVNNTTLMPYICSCGRSATINYSNFKDHKQRCRICGIKKQADARRTPFEEVKAYFEEQGCTLLATEYVNSTTLMPYICSCGRSATISYPNFKDLGQRCRICGIKKQADARRTPFEEVKAYFEEQGCTLLATEYVNKDTKMPYVCSCGHVSKIRFGSFKSGSRCNVCKPKSWGEMHISKFLQDKQIRFDTEVAVGAIGNKRFDFELLDRQIFIEYHGRQHYRPHSFGHLDTMDKYNRFLNGFQNDHIKFGWCRREKIPLLIIPYWDLKRIPAILNDVLSGRVPTFSKEPVSVKKYASIRQGLCYKYNFAENHLCGLFNV